MKWTPKIVKSGRTDGYFQIQSWGPHQRRHFGLSLAPSGPILAYLGAILAPSKPVLAHLGVFLAPFWLLPDTIWDFDSSAAQECNA